MKIVQSYWSVPAIQQDIDHGRHKGGWLDAKYNYISIALSCLLLRKHYDNVSLITDTVGKEILINTLGLPYSSVDTSLDALSVYPHTLWAISKLHAYSKQTEPFLHVDNDVYIWDRFPEKIERASMAAQNVESMTVVYKEALGYLHQFRYLPDAVRNAATQQQNVVSVNTGIFGGCNHSVICEYAERALSLIHANLDKIKSIDNAGILNVLIDQYLFFQFAKQDGVDITCLFDYTNTVSPELFELNKVPLERKYIHLLGHAKKNATACEQIELRLRYEFPEYYETVVRFIDREQCGDRRSAGQEQNVGFITTERLVNQYAVASAPGEGHVRQRVQELAGELSDAEYSFIEKVFEYKDIKDKLHACCYDAETRFINVKRVYEKYQSLTIDALLDQPLVLSAHCRVFTSPWPLESLRAGIRSTPADEVFILIKKDCSQLQETALEGWSKLLYYFDGEAITGTELLNELQNVFSGMSYQSLRDIIVDLITVNLVYDDQLRFME
jgi:hypothetical protein